MKSIGRAAWRADLDSDLDPDVDLLVRAANGAVWLADLHLADRLASAATESGVRSRTRIDSRSCTLVARTRRGC